jgi:hypothetical protein
MSNYDFKINGFFKNFTTTKEHMSISVVKFNAIQIKGIDRNLSATLEKHFQILAPEI